MLVKSDLYFKNRGYGVSDIRSIYSDFIDLSDKYGLTNEDVFDAIMDASYKDIGIIIPEFVKKRRRNSQPRPYFWDRTQTKTMNGKVVPLDTATRFMKFGPAIDLTRASTTQKEILEYELTPRKAFRDLDESKNKRRLKNGAFRGIGWWDPKRKKHKLLPFEVPVEGEEFYKRFADEMVFKNLRSDALIEVPSISRYMKKDYTVIMRVLPVTEGKYYHEWLMTDVIDGCEGRFFSSGSGKKYENGEFIDIYKYASPEDAYCRHSWGALLAAEEKSRIKPGALTFRVSYPRTKEEYRESWKTLNLKTIVRLHNGRERRPNKTEARIQLGRNMGFLGAEGAFDLSE